MCRHVETSSRRQCVRNEGLTPWKCSVQTWGLGAGLASCSPPPPQIRPRSKACDLSCYADTHDINATAKTTESQCYYNNDKWFQSYIILFYYGDSHVYYQGYLMHALVQLKSGKLLNSFCCFKEICFDSWQCSLCWVWIYIPYVKAFNSCFYTILWLVG